MDTDNRSDKIEKDMLRAIDWAISVIDHPSDEDNRGEK